MNRQQELPLGRADAGSGGDSEGIVFFIDGGKLNVRIRGQSVYRRLTEETEFSRRFARMLNKDFCLYLLFSPGLGYGLSCLLNNSLPENSLLIIFETEKLLFPFFTADRPLAADRPQESDGNSSVENVRKSQYLAWQRLRSKLEDMPRIIFCPESTAGRQLHWLEEIFFTGGACSLYEDNVRRRLRKVQGLRFCGRGQRDNLLRECAIRRIRQNWRNHSTILFMSHIWIRNVLVNSLEYEETKGNISAGDSGDGQSGDSDRLGHALRKLTDNKSVILCGAGVGLEDVLERLRRCADERLHGEKNRHGDEGLIAEKSRHAEKNWVIAAVDTALPTLIEAGVVPEIIFMLEGQFANMDDFICSSACSFTGNSLLVHDILAHPPSLRLFRNRAAFLSRFAETSLLDMLPADIPRLPPLGSVGPLALYILLHYSRAPIYHCGFDFAFPPGRTHSRSAPAHQRVLRTAARLSPAAQWGLEVPRHFHTELSGRPALSDELMRSYAARFKELSQRFGSNRVFPFTGAAMTMEGTDTQLMQPRQQRFTGAAEHSAAENGEMAENKEQLPQEPAKKNFRQELQELLQELQKLQYDITVLFPLVSKSSSKDIAGNGGSSGSSGKSALQTGRHETEGHDLERQWSEIHTLLNKRDFLWRFLPGQRSPSPSPSFLTALAGNTRYWSRYVTRLLSWRHT